jgi:hypothetical protein
MAGKDTKRVSWKRIGLCLAIIFAALWLMLILQAQLSAWWIARQVGRDHPIAELLPQPLKDNNIADLKDGMAISRFGYSVQVPWVKAKAVKDWKSAAVIHFEGDTGLVITNPSNYLDLLTNDAAYRNALRPLLGDQATKSHLDYLQVELNARPEAVSIFNSRHFNARLYLLLAMKSLAIPEGTTVIYTLKSPSLNGFQFGDPGKSPTKVQLVLFDRADRALTLTIRGATNGTRPALTQEQINAIVASIRPATQ